eukprot:TRINITY_DN570_c0_g2_i2.p1 TRINITY_DN570_c0_g2~~TRINITY_DN570_c0_g2_i2.p1  ORF type:complete len:263 (-),score=46.40 TRINITY_DN570_c0_g2_i2:52-840(-)
MKHLQPILKLQNLLKEIEHPEPEPGSEKTYQDYVEERIQLCTEMLRLLMREPDDFDFDEFTRVLVALGKSFVFLLSHLSSREEQGTFVSHFYLYLELCAAVAKAMYAAKQDPANRALLAKSRLEWGRHMKEMNTMLNQAWSIKTMEREVCVVCKGPIPGQFVTSPSGPVHSECFKCATCKEMLGDNYFEVDGVPTCENCVTLAANLLTCSACDSTILGNYYSCGEKNFHPECFRCTLCYRPITGNFFEYKGDARCQDCGVRV